MSLGRLVYYSAVLAGWAAFLAWAVVEFTIYGRLPEGIMAAVLAAAVGGAIGSAVNVAAGLGQGDVAALASRAAFGFAGGAVGGAIGGVFGNFVFQLGAFQGLGWLARAIGWLFMGIGIGVIDGIQDRSATKLRNGIIGGAVGGLIGGVVFDPLVALVNSGTGMSSRATALVVLGLAIGACVGLAQVILKEAWLTVVDGYRPGRQLILSRPVTVIGRAEHLPLAFIGAMNAGVAPEQLSISRQDDGNFVLKDHGGGVPPTLNQKAVTGTVRLADGDLIKLGPNLIRFSERRIRAAQDSFPTAGRPVDQQPQQPVAPPPRPPVPPRPPAPVGSRPAPSPPVPVPPRSPSPPLRPGVPQPLANSGGSATPTSSGSRPPPPPPPPPPPKK